MHPNCRITIQSFAEYKANLDERTEQEMSKLIINGIELEVPNEDAQELIKKYEVKKDSGWHDGNKLNYYYPDDRYDSIKEGCLYRERRLSNASSFSTKEKAEQINFQQTLWRKIQRFADEHNEGEINWKDEEQAKYYFYYDASDDHISINYIYVTKHFGQIYFTSKEIATQCLDEFRDELNKYFKDGVIKNEN
jgi:hypothetical protein